MKDRHGLLALVIAGTLGGAFGPGSAGCGLMRSTKQFHQLGTDPRVHYELGAGAMASEVARVLPEAMHTVEERQYCPFLGPADIYVCASLETYAAYGGDPHSGGYLSNGRVFVSPKKENTPTRITGLLTHELSHLHLEQHLGLWGSRRLPSWFAEGLATFVSDGGGAETVSEEAARAAIVTGRVFQPKPSDGIFFHTTASTFGLTPHLFYREAALFLAHLRQRDPTAFRNWLVAVETGEALDASFATAFGKTLTAAWDEFVRNP
jgi:hypothetical protein